MNRYCLACDLKNDEDAIRSYDLYHRNVWPEIIQSIQQSGINSMEIYRTGNRLFMIISAETGFSFENKARMDEANPIVQEWEKLMSVYQQQVPWARPGEKWLLMEHVFKFEAIP